MLQPIENRIPESDTQNRQPPVHRVTFFETNLGGRDSYSSESILGRESVQVARRMGVSTGTIKLIVVQDFLASVFKRHFFECLNGKCDQPLRAEEPGRCTN